MILLISKIICSILGGMLLYIALFLYENEEKILADRIQNLWIVLDDKHNKSSSKLNRIIQTISEILEKYFDKLFGTKFLSWQSLWVSSFFIYSFPFLVNSFLGHIDYPWSIVTIFLSLVFISISHLPFLWDKSQIKIGCLIIFGLYLMGLVNMYFFGKVIWPEENVANLKMQLAFFIAIFLVCLIFLVFIRLIKIAFGILKNNNSLTYNILISITILIISIAVVYIPNAISENSFFEKTIKGKVDFLSDDLDLSQLADLGFGLIHFLSFGAVFPLLLFLILLVINPIQSIFWNSLNRSIYITSKYQILKNNKLIIALAVMLFTYALPDFGKEIIELAKLLKEIK